MHAPATGRVMAEIMMEQKPHIDVSEYKLERFLDFERVVQTPERLII
jgi:glycine/D-amino acid oxidase-like deaminating enzyme